MKDVDRQLRHDLEDLSAPGDPSGVVDRVLRRAARRHARRSAGRVLLAVSVVVFTITAFAALVRVFPSPSSDAASVAENGPIVFTDYRVIGHHQDGSRVLDGWYLYTIDATNGRFIRIGPDVVTEALFPTWSPDGERVAFLGFARGEAQSQSGVYVANADGTVVTEIFSVPDDQQVGGLHWSPDGSRIGYELAALEPNGTLGISRYTIWSMAPDGNDHRQITTTGREMHFAWSPDGKQIVFERFEPIQDVQQFAEAAFDLYVVDANGGEEIRLTEDGVSMDPAWSPDGSQIAFSHGPRGDQRVALIWVDGSGLRELAPRAEAGTYFPYGNTIVWSPDGELVAFSGHNLDDECFISILDIAEESVRNVISSPAPDGCPGQYGMSWAPAVEPDNSEDDPMTTPSPDPSLSPNPNEESNTTEPQDIGIEFRVCFAERLGGIDFLGDGAAGNAWTGVPVRDDGTCPRYALHGKHILAVDHTGDRVADAWIDFPFECWNWCPPYDATDLDGNGADELIVVNSFSIMDYHFFAIRRDANGDLRLEPILVAEPGHEPAGITPGEPLRIDAGGDAGYNSTIECEGYPSEPAIVWSWSDWVIETDQPQEVHVTRLELQPDGLFHVVETNDFTVPAPPPSGVALQTELTRQCGVDWYR